MSPVTTLRRPPSSRLCVDDRVRHCDSREGYVKGVLGSGEVWVILDDMKTNVFALPGFWERIGSRLSAS